jgi:hypothetical protein
MQNNLMTEHVGELVGYGKIYAEKQYELIKLGFAERFSKITAGLLTIFFSFLLGLFILLLASVGLALYLGEIWGSVPMGFLVLSGCYLVITLVILAFRRSLVVNPILTMIINQMIADEDE